MEVPNLKYIKEISENDESFEKNIIDVLKKEFPNEVLIFQKNYDNGNFIEAGKNIHKLKHKISIFGLKKGFELASKFEQEIKKNNTELYSDFLKLLNKIDLYLKSN